MVSTTGWKGAWPCRQQGVSEGNGHGQGVGRCPKPNRRASPGVQTGGMQNEITAGPGNPQAKSQGILPEGSSEKENPLRTRGVGGQVQAGSVRRGAWSRLLCAVTAWRARGSEGGHIDSPGTFIERPKPPHPRPLESDFLEVGFQYEKDLSKTLYRPRMGKWAQGGE